MELLAVGPVPADVDPTLAGGHELTSDRAIGDSRLLVPEGVLVGIENEADDRSSPAGLHQTLDDRTIGDVEHRDVDGVALARGVDVLHE